ncbi:MAG: chlorite dismutase family protein [Verrucomicrobiota bacterium]
MKNESEVTNPTSSAPEPLESLAPREGWIALHLFYQIDRVQWTLFSEEEKLELKTNLTRLAQEIRAMPNTQLLLCSVVSPKADLAVLLLTPDLHDANAFEKRFGGSLGAEILTPVYSYLSLTANNDLSPNNPNPKLPDSPVVGFYSLTCRRGENTNWYSLTEDARSELLKDHAIAQTPWDNSVSRLVTASTGLDDGEWAVTLFAHDILDLKEFTHQTRYDDFSAQYVDFGEFYVGIQLPLDELFRRLDL